MADEIIRNSFLPTPMEQADNLIKFFGDNQDGPGEELGLDDLLPGLIAEIGSLSRAGVGFVLNGMEKKGFLRTFGNLNKRIALSFDGWERYEQVRRGSPSGWNAFMAMKFDPGLRKIVDAHFRPAVLQTGSQLRLLDDEPRAGLIDHRLTKPNHPWTNGRVERMNRTIKEATVRRYFYDSHDRLREHLALFLRAYNFAKRLKSLKGLTPYEHICKTWTEQPRRFRLKPIHHIPGLNR